jgi:hypothetical protein
MRDSWSRVRTAWSEEREKPRWCQDPSLRICKKGFKIVKFGFSFKHQRSSIVLQQASWPSKRRPGFQESINIIKEG